MKIRTRFGIMSSPQNLAAAIRLFRSEIVKGIREYVRCQKDLWQQIPYLALRADGRNSFSAKYSTAYEHGYWVIGFENPAHIDCMTGEFVRPFEPGEPAAESSVFAFAFNLETLDAAKIIENLRREAKEPIGKHYSAEEQKEHKEWRRRKQEKLNLQPLYTRKRLLSAEVEIVVDSFGAGT